LTVSNLRHTWASWHVQNATPLPVLQELGGWSSLKMVQRYAHLSGEHLRAWVGRPTLQLVADNPVQTSRSGGDVILSPYPGENVPDPGLSETQK
jgi:hypothetical protein